RSPRPTLPTRLVAIMRRSFILPFPLARGGRLLALTLGVLGLGACGNLTAGGLAETDVTVSGDAPEPAPAAAASLAWTPPRADQGDDEADGELQAELLLFLEDGAGSRVALNRDKIEIQVDVKGLREADASAALVPAGRYTALHMLFTKIEVEVEGGLIVDGQPILGLVEVELEADSLTVVRPLNLTLDDGDRVEILIDLNAQDWLLQVDPTIQLVAEEIFANAVTVRVR
ncbi:MAG TPA: hypothetical protein VLA43_04390, partial [Longimicrobiales bacterium]|nr:hypothetical protein [Longimicrobiales bacterium]